MFERFTERARQVVVFAQDEARALGHDYIGTEHVLLGLVREEEGVAARVLEGAFDITVDEVRAQVERIVGRGEGVATGQIPFTPRSKKTLELALREAISLGHDYIGTEHILLALVRVEDGVAAQILRDFDAYAETIRDEIVRALDGPGPTGVQPSAPSVPSLQPDVAEELLRVRRERDQALEDQDFERAAAARDRERELLERRGTAPFSRPQTGLRTFPEPRSLPLVLAIVLAALGFPLGLLAGWLIWG